MLNDYLINHIWRMIYGENRVNNDAKIYATKRQIL